MRSRALILVAIAGAALQAAPAIASEPASLVVGPTRVEFIGDDLARPLVVTARVSGGVASTVTFEVVDAAIDPTGGWRAVPYGSTDATLADVLSFGPETFDYVPDGTEQHFDTTLSVDPDGVTQPRFGSLRVTLRPVDVPDAGLTLVTQGAVEIQVLAAPAGANLVELPSATPALRLDGLRFAQVAPWTQVDRLFPDVPWLVNHGPIVVESRGSNAGGLVLDSRVTYSFARLSPFAFLLGTEVPPVFRVENRPRYLLPGAPFVDITTSRIPVDGGPTVDSLPFIGFVRVTATATGNIAGLEATPATRTITFLVFPWKEALFVFLVWLGQREWRHRRGRRVNASAEPPPPTLRSRVRGALGRRVR